MTTDFNAKTSSSPDLGYEHCIQELFENQVKKSPNAPALICEGQQFTFAALNSNANQIAWYLRRLGAGPETLVGICLRRSPEAIAALIGVLKSGAAYLPLDPDYPVLRLHEIVEDSGMTLLIRSEELIDRVASDRITTVSIETDWDAIARENCSNLPLMTIPDNAAYVLYTSGSTGNPKGVVVTHRSITNGLAAVPFQKGEAEVCALNTSLSVGFTISRLFLPLVSGVPLAVIPESMSQDPELLVQALENGSVTNFALVTDFCRDLLESVPSLEYRFRKIRTVTIGGSTVTPELVQSFRQKLQHVTMLNGYASTEIGGAAIVWVASGDYPSVSLSTGRPFPNTEVYILDENMDPVPPDSVGEIYVGAAHLARGYLNRPRLTAERFLPNAFTERHGARMYRTGDLGRCSPGGQIEVLGRIDNQVKIRGFRVELAEVEAALQLNDGVKECAVAAMPISNDIRLVAYVVVRPDNQPTVTTLISWLRMRLPAHMIPNHFMFLQRLPRTIVGKLDRQALPFPEMVAPICEDQYEAPRNPVEQVIADVWSDVLGLTHIGIHDDFFELGGHSLLAVRIAVRVRDRLGLELPSQWFLEFPTIADLGA